MNTWDVRQVMTSPKPCVVNSSVAVISSALDRQERKNRQVYPIIVFSLKMILNIQQHHETSLGRGKGPTSGWCNCPRGIPSPWVFADPWFFACRSPTILKWENDAEIGGKNACKNFKIRVSDIKAANLGKGILGKAKRSSPPVFSSRSASARRRKCSWGV